MRLTDQGKCEGTFNLIFIGYLILNNLHLSQFDYLWLIIFDCILISYLHSSLNFQYKCFSLHNGIEDVDRSIGNDVETLKGTWKLHSIKKKLSSNVFALDKRKYSCFCHVCIDNTKSNDVSEKKMYVNDWKHTELNTKGKMSVAMFEEMQSEETTI